MEGQIGEKRVIFTNKTLIQLVIPLMLEQLLSVTIGMMDTVMVTSVGEAAVSGVSLADAINKLVIQIFAALATGGAVVASQYIGGHREKDASCAAKQLFYVMGALSFTLAFIGAFFCGGILKMIYGQIDHQVMADARTYFWICALSYPGIGLYNAGAALFRAMGNSKTSMITSISMNFINLFGNALLIYGFDMGVAGAAIATLFARVLGAVVMIIMLHNRKRTIYMDNIFNVEIRTDMMMRILKIGVPNGFENATFHLGKLLVSGLVSTFGTAAIAANAIANNIAALANVPGNSICLALVPVTGQCIGAGDYDQAKRNINKLLLWTNGLMCLLDIALLIWVEPLVSIFNLSPEAVSEAARVLRLFAIFGIFMWVPAFALPFALRAAGDTKFTMWVSMISMWTTRIGLSYVFGRYLGWGLMGVWAAMIVDWAVRMACFLGRYISGKWKNFNVI
jgi:putative MATE family efflux protein